MKINSFKVNSDNLFVSSVLLCTGGIHMRKLGKQVLESIIIAAIVPCMVFSTALRLDISTRAEGVPSEQETEYSEKSEAVLSIPVLKANGDIEQMALEDYVAHVVLGEVSAKFHPEALKAQAVAARTYTLRCTALGDKHPQGAVCTDYRCCQAYREPEEYLESGGTEEELQKIRNAVDATASEVLYYNDELICATYFACSGGTTEDAKDVWGQSYPYLQPVSSPEEENYDQQVILTAQELQQRLGVQLTGSPREWFGMTTYTDGKGVALMRIGARLYTGVELRKLLELRSTMIAVSFDESGIVFETKGYGHRVGMSQHGANAMAAAGEHYQSILSHYYCGVTLEQYHCNND